MEDGRYKEWRVNVVVGRDYDNGYSGEVRSIESKVEKDLILEGLKGEFDLNEMIKSMVEKYS